MLAITEAGSQVVPLNFEFTESEFNTYLSKAGISVLMIPANGNPPAESAARSLNLPVVQIWLDDDNLQIQLDPATTWPSPGVSRPESAPPGTAIVLFTSGTSGCPKAVPVTHSNLTASIDNIMDTIPIGPEDVTLNVMPLFHVHGIVASVLATLCSGGCVILPRDGKFSARRFWSTVRQFRCTWFTAVPTIHRILMNTQLVDTDVSHLRFIRSSSAPLEPSLLRAMEERYHVPVLEAYAMTETAYQITSNDLDRRKPGTAGFPHGSVSITILDRDGNPVSPGKTGEVCVAGPNVISGYLDAPNGASYFRSGYFRTGDEGFADADGFVTITGRLDDQINRGGEKICPAEIEGVLSSHSDVVDCVAFGIPDPVYSQSVGVAVTIQPQSPVDTNQLIQFMSGRLVKAKVPTKVWIVDAIPKTATGKIQRRLVASRVLNT